MDARPEFAARPELVARHEAERAEWHTDRLEADWTREEAREAHLDIVKRFGPDGPPTAAQLANGDYRTRQTIVGSSALWAADLAAETRGPSIELAEEYAQVAERWAEHPDLRFLGRLREAATLQRVGDRHGALAAFRDAQQQSGSIDNDAFPWMRGLLADLEVHVALLAMEIEAPKAVAKALAAARSRLAERALAWQALPEGRRAMRRAAEVSLLAGDTKAAVAGMEELSASAAGPSERAETLLALGEIHQFARKDPATAEAVYWRAVEQGPLEEASAEARLRLVALSLDLDVPRIGIRTADELLMLGARVVAGREAEARYWRGRCLLELGRWTDAVPSFEEGAREDPSSPFTLACAARLHRRVRELDLPDTRAAAQRLIELVNQAPSPPPVAVPQDWATAWRAQRAAFAWEEVVEELHQVSRRMEDPEQAEAARSAARRILRERTIFAQKAPDGAPTGRR